MPSALLSHAGNAVRRCTIVTNHLRAAIMRQESKCVDAVCRNIEISVDYQFDISFHGSQNNDILYIVSTVHRSLFISAQVFLLNSYHTVCKLL